MKKILAMLLAVMLLVNLTACGAKPQENNTTTAPAADNTTAAPADETTVAQETAAEETTAAPEETTVPETTAAPAAQDVFAFEFEGVKLVPGQAFDSAALPEAESVYQMPSCAIEGTDNVYNYGTIEVTAFDDGTGEVIYSVYIVDANTPTAEGLYIGDMLDHVVAAYGDDYIQESSQITYQKGDTLLVILMDGDYVASIDFRWAT